MRQGSLVDCIITEPDSFEERYVVKPADLPKRPTETQLTTGESSKPGTKARAAWEDAQAREAEWAKWEEESEGREVVSAEWVERAEQIRDVLLTDSEIGPRLRDATLSCQEGWQWSNPELGLCLYKPDLETEGGGLWDLKKTQSANPRKFGRLAYDFGYDLQLAHYHDGYQSRHWGPPSEAGIIAYEFEPPFDYAILPFSSELLLHGEERRQKAHQRIREWHKSSCPASYGLATLELPPWIKNPASPEPEPLSIDDIKLF